MPYEKSKNIGKCYRLNSMANKANWNPTLKLSLTLSISFSSTCHSTWGSFPTCSTPWQPLYRDSGTCPIDNSPNQRQVGAGGCIHFLVCSGLALRVMVCRFPDTQAKENPNRLSIICSPMFPPLEFSPFLSLHPTHLTSHPFLDHIWNKPLASESSGRFLTNTRDIKD